MASPIVSVAALIAAGVLKGTRAQEMECLAEVNIKVYKNSCSCIYVHACM